MAELNFPNFADAIARGTAQGAARRDDRQQQDDRANLRGLAPGIIAGDPNALSQAAVIDPDAAQNYQGVGDSQMRKLGNAIKLIDSATDPRQKEAYYQQIRPWLDASSPAGQTPPATFAEAEPLMEQARVKIAMAQKTAEEQRNAIVSPGSAVVDPQTGQVIYERPFAPQAQSFEFAGPDGRPRRYTFNTRTREYEEAQLGGAPPAPSTRFKTSTGEVIDISQVKDPALQQQIIANPAAFGMVPDGETLALPEVQRNGQGGTPLVGRAPEEQAALTTAAQEQAKLAVLPEEERIKRDSAIQQAVGIETGKTAAEKAVAAPALISTLQNSLDSIDELLASPGLSGIVGLGSMNPLNKIPGTDARGLIARADQIAGQSFLAAFNQLKGGGAITEREGQAATQAIARLDRSQSEKDYRQALQDLRDAISPAIARARQQAAGPQGRQIKRTGTLNGRKVVLYSDGTTEYAD